MHVLLYKPVSFIHQPLHGTVLYHIIQVVITAIFDIRPHRRRMQII